MSKKWNDHSEILENFETARRSLIGNMFCTAVRNGADTPAKVVNEVLFDAIQRVDRPAHEATESLDLLIKLIEKDGEGLEFAEHILWRESLTFEEKDKLKKEAGSQFSQQAMQGKAPTEKQIALLKKKGVKDIPTDRLTASQLIGELLKK